ncbi:hypothetical protein [Streptomyces sp. ME19-01-6]|uniref:hypothetical protein n=1 Tax=Streptomyces sp. ME19-01-6 TaxID=3028686 RepID=UPI0029A2CE62|nr:hypothetical protein [Streptomyces sp. ME19-01-6]MDX3225370.1 hypothetical protein [Streptomyces sp. ME19-01-6]
MIDEAYAVNASLPEAERSARRLLAMQIACETYWVGGGLLGVALGAALPAPIKGLEFALCALFVTLLPARHALDGPSPEAVAEPLFGKPIGLYFARIELTSRYEH